MGKIYKNATELIGKTPLVEFSNIEKKLGLEARILAKLEYFFLPSLDKTIICGM